MSVKRKDLEYAISEFVAKTTESGVYGLETGSKMIFKAFFELYDFVEGTNHSGLINKLYFGKNSLCVNLEKIAQDEHVDISTLRRYRKKYLKALLYILRCPNDSALAKLIKALPRNEDNL